MTNPRQDTTIFAPTTATGRAGVAVIRISGDGAQKAIVALCGKELPSPRTATLRHIRDHRSGEILDNALLLWFPAPRSFTGEDVAELHVHGGMAVMAAVLETLAALPGLRMAEPGEFSRRAFRNGKMDLTEAEALADLIDAETSAQRRQALRQLDGELGRLYQGWAERLKLTLARTEAYLDFPDEDIPTDIAQKSGEEIQRLLSEMSGHLDDGRRGERLRLGVSIAILGPPNAGKSSLLNALARRDAAIVSERAGTTRDVVDVALEIGGHAVAIADTAGLRQTTDEIEHEGIRRAMARASAADIRILVIDGAEWPEIDPAILQMRTQNSIAVLNKADLHAQATLSDAEAKGFIPVSAKNASGIKRLEAEIKSRIDGIHSATSAPLLTRARHRSGIEECVANLCRAASASQEELRAEDMRLAMRSLGRITGKVDVEDLLDVIFREFCLGK